MKIFNEKVIKLEIDSLALKIIDIKNKICQLEAIEINKRSSIFNGEIIVDDSKSLLDFNIGLGLTLVLRQIKNEELIWLDRLNDKPF